MNMRRNDRLARLVEVAFGEEPESSLGELTKAESVRLGQLRRLADGLTAEWHIAPLSVVETAKSLFEGPRPVSMAVSSFQSAVARAAAAEVLHVGYEHGGVRARAVYAKEPNGWRVMGQVTGGTWTYICGDEVDDTDSEGRFEVFVEGADMPELLFVNAHSRLLVTPPRSQS